MLKKTPGKTGGSLLGISRENNRKVMIRHTEPLKVPKEINPIPISSRHVTGYASLPTQAGIHLIQHQIES
jgi:hypothetical protein